MTWIAWRTTFFKRKPCLSLCSDHSKISRWIAQNWNADMTEDFLGKLWTLVRLRYLLIWAHARTRNGKIVLLFMLYLIGMSAAFLIALGGIGTALADEEFAQDGFFARWIL